MLTNLFNDQVRKRKAIPMQALNLYPLEVIFADYDLPRSSPPALAKPIGVPDIAGPEMCLQSVLVLAFHASLGAVAAAGAILALFAWSGAGL